MKAVLYLLLCLPLSALDADRFLYAISQVETGSNPRAIGKAGERSQYQFTAQTWHRYTRAPFSKATSDPLLARLVAQTHLQAILKRFEARGATLTPKRAAMAWNPNDSGDYAVRVSNLYYDR